MVNLSLNLTQMVPCHNVSVTEKNIKCDQACPQYRDNYYCSRVLSAAIIGNAIH